MLHFSVPTWVMFYDGRSVDISVPAASRRCHSRVSSPYDANSGQGSEVPCLTPTLSTCSSKITGTIDCSHPMSHRVQSMGCDVHLRLPGVPDTTTRMISIIFWRLWQLLMEQICSEIVSRLIKYEGTENSQERLAEGNEQLATLLRSYWGQHYLTSALMTQLEGCQIKMGA